MVDVGEIPFLDCDHLPQDMLENIAEQPKRREFIDALRQMPLEKSTPLLQQIILKATVQDVAKYHKITIQSVYKKNKYSLKILKALLK
jgi:hypothetical protein